MSSVLVVDDEAPMREFYDRALAAGGYHAIDVRTAEEALDRLELVSEVDVVIADLHMPGHGGVWLVEQIRTRFPHVVVILATADEAVSGSLTLQPSVVSYLVKPITARALLDAVADAMARKRSRDAPAASKDGGEIDAWLDRKLTHRRQDGDS